MQARKEERSLAELFTDLTRDIGLLVRQEVGLATTELSHKATRAGREVATLIVGGLVVYAGLLAVLAAIIIGLAAAGMTWWLAALVVGVVVAVIGAVLIQRSLERLKHLDLTPQETLDTLKEDAQWARKQIS